MSIGLISLKYRLKDFVSDHLKSWTWFSIANTHKAPMLAYGEILGIVQHFLTALLSPDRFFQASSRALKQRSNYQGMPWTARPMKA